MPAIEISDPLPPAITLPREVLEFAISQDLEKFGESSLVAHTWRWILQGSGPAPISQVNWSQFDGKGPPSTATLAAESAADQPPLLPRRRWAELNKARFICWWCTANLGEEVPLRFHPWDGGPTPTVTEDGSVTVTIREVHGG